MDGDGDQFFKVAEQLRLARALQKNIEDTWRDIELLVLDCKRQAGAIREHIASIHPRQ